jgi:rRNA-processing protein FCF1
MRSSPKVLVDTNCLIIYVLGIINPVLINTNKNTSIYDESDFYLILELIKSPDNLLILPNIWTEVDNLLNRNLTGNYKYLYFERIRSVMQENVEKYIESVEATKDVNFYQLGITDTLILIEAKNCELLITSDGDLSDRANAQGIKVFDMSKYKNEQIKAGNKK